MKYPKQIYRLLVVVLVVVAFSLVSVVSPAHAETLSATDQAAADSTLESLEAEAAASGIGVRIVNGVTVFHTRDGLDLEIAKICDGSDGVKYHEEVMTLESALAWQLSPQTDMGITGDSEERIMSAMPVATMYPVCYAQRDPMWNDVLLGYGTNLNRPTIGQQGCYVVCAAMEAATYGIGLYDYLADPHSLNTWLSSNGGFGWDTTDGAYTNISFEKMSSLPGGIIGGTEQSFQHTGYDQYSRAWYFMAGQVPQHPEYKPSLPIMEMENVLGVHFCAWYQSDGMSTPETNRIVQPTLNDSSDTSLKCSVKDAEDSSKQYYPVGNSDLMRVGWKS